uniref:Uncharacterized protein n=1 Tax=Anguilla anguilla TaxID=7936 RepID=A0A0E9XUQ2_ANGAN
MSYCNFNHFNNAECTIYRTAKVFTHLTYFISIIIQKI